MRVSVLGIGVWGPGLRGWKASRPVLAGGEHSDMQECAPPPSPLLPATERRRTSPAVRLALHVAREACEMSGLHARELHAVFGAANGDGAVVHAVLDSLASGGGHVSPTQFHNSVHNAAAGYWTIGGGSRQPATAIGCHDATAGMALLSATAEVAVDDVPVLLCVYDLPLPEPLHSKRPVPYGFGAALVLAPIGAGHAVAELGVEYAPRSAPPSDEGGESSLVALARANPAGRMLPVLQALACGDPRAVRMPVLDGCLDITVALCSTTGASLG